MSSKGKGRATSTDIADAPAPALDAKSAAIAADLAVHSSLLQSLLPSLTCQICLSLMHRPFALAPCGHVSCYSCLVTWFTEKPPDALQTALEALANGSVPPLPLLEAAPPPPAPARPTIPIPRRKKTCPQCRARVFQKPVEVWLIKDMVKQVVRSGLADPEAVPPELRDGTPAPDGTQNAWAHIFPDGAAEDEARRNVFRAMILRENMGIRDEEDGGIFRCVDCAHELEEGICSHCGRVYPAHDPDWILDDSVGYDEDEGGVGDDLGFMLGHHPELRYLDDDEDSMQSTEEDDLMPGFPPLHWLAHHRHDEHHGDEGEGSEGDGDEGHGEEEDYESSFIDDEDDNGEGGFDEDVLYEIGRAMGLQPSSPIVISSDEEGGPHMRAPRRHSRVIVQSDGEGDDDDDENDEAGPSVREPRRRSQTVVHSDSEEDEDSEAGPPARAPRRQPAFIHSDEEDDEFDAGHEDDFDGRSDENNGFAVGDLAAIVAQRERELYGEDGSVPRGQGGGMSYEWGYSDGGEDDQSNDGGYSDGDGGVYF
ncbi:hypothetical protein BDW22DRAFT_199394 [Trametopsis cervina]|nr:hypothetical protein BDW22DRAFT_199394 [Trametopsis cervina]